MAPCRQLRVKELRYRYAFLLRCAYKKIHIICFLFFYISIRFFKMLFQFNKKLFILLAGAEMTP